MCFNFIRIAQESLFDQIVQAKSKNSRKRYMEDKIKFLEFTNWKSNTLIANIRDRFINGKAYMTKDEVYNLVLWKLNFGNFRPVAHYIKENSDDEVIEATNKAFNAMIGLFNNSKQLQDYNMEDFKNYAKLLGGAIEILKELTGVGPSTASIILSCLSGINDDLAPPFFSDESIMYFYNDKTLLNNVSTNFCINKILPIYFGLIKENDLELSFTELEKGITSIRNYERNKDNYYNFTSPFQGIDKKVWSKFVSSDTIKFFKDEFENSPIRNGARTKNEAEEMAQKVEELIFHPEAAYVDQLESAQAVEQGPDAQIDPTAESSGSDNKLGIKQESRSQPILEALNATGSSHNIKQEPTAMSNILMPPKAKKPKSMNVASQSDVMTGINTLLELAVNHDQKFDILEQRFGSLETKLEEIYAQLKIHTDNNKLIYNQNEKLIENNKLLYNQNAELFEQLTMICYKNQELINHNQELFNRLSELENNIVENLKFDSKRRKT
ncbi:uncharacterized protein KGF55_005418 [Candida pseudojiufengensis]|uniref:uncharacterized protein n=1 Tax=Candida pseudojiufengensis TaxID=497109 RepID=UPI0022251927|nr:uncharacterized protein KGF55_005418 [Candida pseudojiufengensis]KAI5959268.1 hypothetical protein KGF55_005418 [Candida pseudojiufengensis]